LLGIFRYTDGLASVRLPNEMRRGRNCAPTKPTRKEVEMNKAELVNAINATGNYTSRTNAANALDDVLSAITNGVSTDGKVQIVGFGTFTKKTRAARTGRNPQTGATINIGPSTTVGFKAGKTLKDSL